MVPAPTATCGCAERRRVLVTDDWIETGSQVRTVKHMAFLSTPWRDTSGESLGKRELTPVGVECNQPQYAVETLVAVVPRAERQR